MQRIFIPTIFVFLFSMAVDGQDIPPSQGFLELIDYQNKLVAGAEIRLLNGRKCEAPPIEQEPYTRTDVKGLSEKGLPVPYHNLSIVFSINKPGYYLFLDCFSLFGFLKGGWRNNRENPISIELLKIPENRAEKKAVGDEQSKREFFLAARQGDPAAVQKFIKSGMNPNLTTSDLRGVPATKDVPIILFAVASGKFAAVNEFLSAGVDVRKIPNILIAYLNANPYWGNSGESEEITKGKKIYEDGFATLVKKGADVKVTEKANDFGGDQRTTLMIAAYDGYPRTVKFLLDQGVSVEVKDGLARTALIHAAMSPHQRSKTAVMELLLQAGADPNALAENANRRYSDYCESPVMWAVRNDDPEALKMLLKYRVDVNLGCQNGRNALSIARDQQKYYGSKNSGEIIKILIEAGAK